MIPAKELQSIEAIKQLKGRYCRIIDTKQWHLLAALFTEDATFDGFGSAPPGATRDMFVAGVSQRLRNAISVHHLHLPEILIIEPDSARGIFPLMDYLEFPPDEAPREAPESAGYIGYGHYEEEYRRQEGHWRIAYSRLSRLRIDPLPAGRPARAADRLAALPDWLEKGRAIP